MEAMYKEAVSPSGVVDLAKVKTWKQLDEFRFPPSYPPDYIGKRLWHIDLQNHHIAPKEWVRELLKNQPPYSAYTQQQWDILFEEIPGFLMHRTDHVGAKGTASFHAILNSRLPSNTTPNATTILAELEATYMQWDSAIGPKVWAVAFKWLQQKGVQ